MEIVECLLKNNANPNIQANNQETPLHWAVNSKEMVELLLKYGSDKNIINEEGKTPIDLVEDEEIKKLFN